MIAKVLLWVIGLATASASDESCVLQVHSSESKEDGGRKSDALKPIETTKFEEAEVIPAVIFGDGNENGGFAITQIKFTESDLKVRNAVLKRKAKSGSGKKRRGRRMRKKIKEIIKNRKKSRNQVEECIELALRAKIRYPEPANIFPATGTTYGPFGINDAGNGCTCPPLGEEPGSDALACWNYEPHVNTNFCGTGTLVLSDLTYELCIYREGDSDKLCGDPFNAPEAIRANIFGDNDVTGNEGVTTADPAVFQDFLDTKNVVQQSQNLGFLRPFIPNFESLFGLGGDATYIISLAASQEVQTKHGPTSVIIGKTSIKVMQDTTTSCSATQPVSEDNPMGMMPFETFEPE